MKRRGVLLSACMVVVGCAASDGTESNGAGSSANAHGAGVGNMASVAGSANGAGTANAGNHVGTGSGGAAAPDGATNLGGHPASKGSSGETSGRGGRVGTTGSGNRGGDSHSGTGQGGSNLGQGLAGISDGPGGYAVVLPLGVAQGAAGHGSTNTVDGCAQQQVPIERLPPDVLLVQDRSLSMTWDVAGGTCDAGFMGSTGQCGEDSRWYLVSTAVEKVIQATESSVNWGLFYLGDEATECEATTTPAVPITPQSSYALVKKSFDAATFTGAAGTPTAAVVNNAVSYMKTLTDRNPKYLLVATDGEPNCANGILNATDAAGAADAAAAALAAGIPVFVIGIATSSSSTATKALNDMATAGGEAQTGTSTKYYSVTDTASLQAALDKIVGVVASCTISLANKPPGLWTIAISAVNETGATVQIPEDAANGWSYTDDTKMSIELNGTSCTKLKNGKYSNFNFVYTCEGGTIDLPVGR